MVLQLEYMRWRAAGKLLIGGLAIFLAWPAAAARHRETLIYSRFDLDPGELRFFEFPSKEKDARLDVRFKVLQPKEGAARVIVLSAKDFLSMRRNQAHRQMGATPYQQEARLRAKLAEPGEHIVMIHLRKETQRKSQVEIEVALTTGPDPASLPVQYASPRKRLIVVSVSLIGFLIIAGLSGQALWRAARR